jgi:uncharacterized protein (DUF433 family)
MTTDRPCYQVRITQNPEIMTGKPVIKGTRIPVDLVLGHLAQNPDLDELFAAYPHLTLDDIKACLAYAQAVVEAENRRARRKAGSAPTTGA